jgi:serine/threonine protein kinase
MTRLPNLEGRFFGDFSLGPRIASTVKSDIYEAIFSSSPSIRDPNQKYVLKVCQSRDVAAYECEICRSLSSCRCAAVGVRFYDVYGRSGMLMKHYLRGDLYDFSRQQKLTNLCARYVMKRVLKALEFLHDLGYAHRDVKLENIFLDHSNPFPKSYLGDFELTTRCPRDTFLQGPVGTVRTHAPELFAPDAQYTESVDMWAFGVSVYEVLTGKAFFDYDEKNEWDFSHKVCAVDQHVERLRAELTEAGASRDAIHLVLSLLRVHPSDRLTAKAALMHPFFTHQADDYEEMFSPPEVLADWKEDVNWLTAALEKVNQF